MEDDLEEPLLQFLDDPTIPSEKKTGLLELASRVRTEKTFMKLQELSRSTDETQSYFAITSIGKHGEKGLVFILNLLQDHPTDLKIDAGRSTLALYPKKSFDLIADYLDGQVKVTDEFKEILSSILDELDHVVVKKHFNSLAVEQQEKIDLVFEKHELGHHLDYFLGE